MQIKLESESELDNRKDKSYEWGAYLLDEFGYDKAHSILATYEDLGWISKEVREGMEDILISSETQTNTDYDLPDIDWPPLSSLQETNFEKHAYSIHYILEISEENSLPEI